MKIHPRCSGLIAFPVGFIGILISKVFKISLEKVFIVVGTIGLIIVFFLYDYFSKIYYAEEWKEYEERKKFKKEQKRLKREEKEKQKMDK